MKRVAALFACLALLFSFALADGFDQKTLEQLENCDVYLDPVNEVDTIVRPQSQPYQGVVENGDAELSMFLDFIEKPSENATFMRLTLSLESFEFLAANEMSITAGGKNYVFNVFPEVWEYDLTYYEDYIVCMTDESLPMIKAMARSKTDTFPVRLTGVNEVQGTITLPLDEIASLYDAYINCGGAAQELGWFREVWPVSITKE